MPNKTILLTGATGYLGSELLRFWIDQGHYLIVLKRSTSSHKRIQDLESRFISYDVDLPGWEKSFKKNKIDIVVHVAASYGRKGESLSELLEANIFFPIRLLELAIQGGVRYFINTSSSLPKEINDYALSKFQFHEWIKKKKDHIHSVNLVLEYFYGSGDDDWKFISMVVKKLKENTPVIEFTSGLQKRDFIYISDVVSAYDMILNKIDDLQSAVDVPVGSGDSYSLKSVLELCKKISGNRATTLNFGAIQDREGETKELVADLSIMKSLCWERKYSLEMGLRQIIE
jgi:nucleoside-diphosphate-sugar epimerase